MGFSPPLREFLSYPLEKLADMYSRCGESRSWFVLRAVCPLESYDLPPAVEEK